MINTKECVVTFGKVQISATQVRIEKKPNGFFYTLIESIYVPEEYQSLSSLCWNTKREPFKIVNKEGAILKDFHCWGLIMCIDAVLRVDDIVKSNLEIKMLNKIK